MTGRLAFASQHIFRRLGRAMLVAIYRQITGRTSVVGNELQMSLLWWLQTLEQGMCEVNICCPACLHPFASLCVCAGETMETHSIEDSAPAV